MFKLIYSLLIYLYKGLVSVVALFNTKAKDKVDGIRDTKKSLLVRPIAPGQDVILMHCASQGEHEQALPIIRWILNHTDYTIVLSFFSASGYKNSNYDNNERVIKTYLPFDLRSDISTFINSIKPNIAIIIKNEWWWNLLDILNSNSIPTYLVSATIRKEHYFIKYPFSYFRECFRGFQAVFVVDNDSHENILKIYKGKVIEAGDTRIDQTNYIKRSITSKIVSQDEEPKNTIIYGSVWKSDLEAIKYLIRLNPEASHLIFPHELSQKNIDLFESKIKNSNCVDNIHNVNQGIKIITKMGELKYAYDLAKLAYIGGGFGAGIHNILEAAVYYIPTIFGPNYQKSNEAKVLLSKKCSFFVNHVNEISSILQIINEEKNRNEIELNLKSYFSPKHSPTEIICQEIFKKIDLNV